MEFTKTDKALLERAARMMAEAAKGVYNPSEPPSPATRDCKAASDRYLRDERDLRALAKRLSTVEADRPREFHDFRDGAPAPGPEHDLDVAGRKLRAGT